MSDLDDLRTSLEGRTTEELVSILRNRNEDEWRLEVFDLVASILATRGVSPATVTAMGPEGEEVVEGRPLATVARYFSPAEAHASRMALEAPGIPAWVVDRVSRDGLWRRSWNESAGASRRRDSRPCGTRGRTGVGRGPACRDCRTSLSAVRVERRPSDFTADRRSRYRTCPRRSTEETVVLRLRGVRAPLAQR